MNIPRPMLASSADRLPRGPQWTYEVKWDGYRALALKTRNGVRLISRNHKDLSRDYPAVVSAVERLESADVVLDGEVVAIDSTGRPSFQALQHRRTATMAVVYYAFDVLRIGDDSMLDRPLDHRRKRLKEIIGRAGPLVLLSEPLPGSPDEIER